MKNIILSFVFTAILGGVSNTSFAQSVVTDTVTVQGICGMCEERILEAAYGKGVKFVSWDKVTKKMVVTYKKSKTELLDIEKRVAAAGYKTERVAATEQDYNRLPDCCRYETLETH
jgi:mercuric ion binding protein